MDKADFARNLHRHGDQLLHAGLDVSDFRNPFGGGALAGAVVFFVCVMVKIVTLLAD